MRPPTRRRLALLVAVVLALAAACSGGGDPGSGGDGDGSGGGGMGTGGTGRPTAAVAMGDSFIAGEAGRWQGNSPSASPGHAGTDRAHVDGRVDLGRVYPGDGGCHRSDVADITSSGIEVDALVNLACGGARAANLWRSSQGGRGQHGEPSQADQLAAVAADHDVELVVLSVGGNDLGFGDIITGCGLAYVTSRSPDGPGCAPAAQAELEGDLPAAMAGVRTAIAEVRAVLEEAGQAPGTTRLVVRTYPSPVPRGADVRYPSTGRERAALGGCPFGDADATWARDVLVPRIADELAAVAAEEGVELLDVRDAFDGHEVCARGAAQVGGDGPDPATAEWVRWVDLGFGQGDVGESLHPNAYGQQAGGRCLALLWAQAAGGRWSCRPTPGQGPDGMQLTPA